MVETIRSLGVDTILVLGLLIAGAFQALMTIRNRAHDREAMTMVRRVDAVLTVWAEHWGDPPDVVRPLLLKALGKEPR